MTDQTIQEPKSKLGVYDDEPATPAVATPTGEQKTQQPPAEKSPQTSVGAEAAAAKPGQEGAPPAPVAEEGPTNWAEARKALAEMSRENKELKRKFKDIEPHVKVEEEIPDQIKLQPQEFWGEVEKRQFVRLVESSRADMIDEVGAEDFEAKEEAFKAAAGADPKLAQRLYNSRDPAKFAYTQGKKLLEQKASAGDPADDVVARVKAALEKDYDLVPKVKPASGNGTQPTAQAPQQKPNAPRLPTSLADVQSGAPRNGAAPAGRRSRMDAYDD